MRPTTMALATFVAATALFSLPCLSAEPDAPAGAGGSCPPGPKGWLDFCRGFQKQCEERTGTCFGVLVNYQGQFLLNGQRRQGKGKSAFSYDLGIDQNLWKDAMLVVRGTGGSGRGLDPFVGSFLGVNADAGEPRCIYVSELFLQQSLLEEKIVLAAGKVDLTLFFDNNQVANCENSQFLSPSLVNNPTIPFPDYAIGAVARIVPAEWLYVMAGVADAQAVGTETGANTAFHGQDHTFSIYEVGLTPKFGELCGNYRFILWYDPQPLERIDGTGAKRDDTGLALSFDQQVTDRVTLFGRYGFAHQAVREVAHFWSVGGQLAAPLACRPDDVLGLGVGQAVKGADFKRSAGGAWTETLFEVYYNFRLNEYVSISPDLQVILNPGGGRDNDPAVVAGIRAVFEF